MKSMKRKLLETRVFFFLLIAFSLMFVLLLRPFWGAIFWAGAMAIIFHPLHRRIVMTFGGRNNIAASLTLLIGFIIVIVPAISLIFAFVQEGIQLYQRIEDEEINPAEFIERIGSAVPFIPDLMQRFGINTTSIREYLSSSAVNLSQLLAQEALNFGRNTFSFTLRVGLMLYLTFFLLRDGDKMLVWLHKAVPLGAERKRILFEKFTEVTRATIKGNLVVAAVQGALGGLIFWILDIPAPVLWAVVMGFLSLIPAVGASLVWAPVAIYLYSTGAWQSATILVAYGAIIIGLADNILRPMLVGRDTKLPDYMVLFSTLGGLTLLGINGFVIGPLVAALFLTFWVSFIRDFNEGKPEV